MAGGAVNRITESDSAEMAGKELRAAMIDFPTLVLGD
jgi:hypothetical protein